MEEIRMVDDSGDDNGSIWDYFQKEPIASGQEIAEELNYTRANVSRILKKIFGETYHVVERSDPEKGPFEIAVHISKMFGVDFSVEMEVKKFFRLFPPEQKKLIESDGTARMEAGIRRLSIMH
jgi:hypothetical protein